MNLKSIRMCLLIGCIGTALSTLPALAQRVKFRPNLDEGQRVYKQNCVNCHGAEGKGDGVAAEKLDPKPADLTSTKTQTKKDAELLEIIKFGRPGTAMPSWMSELDEPEMQNVLAYLRSLAR
jgi:mono/diheme cytochrome c family protein